MPWLTDVGLLYYRKDLLDQSGFFSPLQSWDQLKQMALQVKQASGFQHGYVFPLNPKTLHRSPSVGVGEVCSQEGGPTELVIEWAEVV